MTLALLIVSLVLWAIPVMHALQSRSGRILLEVAILMVISLGLPFFIRYMDERLYGIAANFTLDDALIVAILQLLLWLGGLQLALRGSGCRIPDSMAARWREDGWRDSR